MVSSDDTTKTKPFFETLRDAWPVLVAITVLANSAALLYGFRQMDELSASVRVAFLTVARGVQEPSQQRRSDATPVSTSRVRVELYSDFACPFCRASVGAVDSARAEFGDSVTWVYRYLPNVASELSLLSARAGACVSDATGPWSFYSELRGESWSRRALERALLRIGTNLRDIRSCTSADSTHQRIWLDVFRAAALRIDGTPTLVVDGLVVPGRVRYEPLSALIRERLKQGRRVGSDRRARRTHI